MARQHQGCQGDRLPGNLLMCRGSSAQAKLYTQQNNTLILNNRSGYLKTHTLIIIHECWIPRCGVTVTNRRMKLRNLHRILFNDNAELQQVSRLCLIQSQTFDYSPGCPAESRMQCLPGTGGHLCSGRVGDRPRAGSPRPQRAEVRGNIFANVSLVHHHYCYVSLYY